MFTFKKCSKRLKRTVSGALCCLILSGLFAVPVSAAEPLQSVVVVSPGKINGSSVGSTYLDLDYSVSTSPQSGILLSTTSTASQTLSVDPWLLQFTGFNTPIDGSVALYVSWYLKANFNGSFTSPAPSVFRPSVRLMQRDGTTYEELPSAGFMVSSFSSPVIDGQATSRGYLLKGRVNADSIVSISQIDLGLYGTGSDPYVITKPSGIPGAVSIVFPSIVCLTGSASDISSMEGIADEITAQSQILNSMYGDIMSLLNDLYSRLGDLKTVQEVANSYFAQLIPLVNSISTNTANIYSLLQTQFQLLRTLIATESGNIQDAIEQQTEDLIAYFDTVLSGSTGNMPEKSDDLESSVGNVSDAESDYQSSATERFDQLVGAFNGFSGGTLGGVTLAATLFSRVWSALGEYSIVYSWPLLLGLCLVVIGRLSRFSGGQSSSVKNRGDSDA